MRSCRLRYLDSDSRLAGLRFIREDIGSIQGRRGEGGRSAGFSQIGRLETHRERLYYAAVRGLSRHEVEDSSVGHQSVQRQRGGGQRGCGQPVEEEGSGSSLSLFHGPDRDRIVVRVVDVSRHRP